MIVGQLRHGNYYCRCPECGDSQRDTSKAHFSIRLSDGLYGCLRCGYGGRLSTKQFMTLMMTMDPDDLTDITELQGTRLSEIPDIDTAFELIMPGSFGTRASRLSRYHLYFQDRPWDVFIQHDPYDQEAIGLHLRAASGEKTSMSWGERGLSWRRAGMNPLTSSPSKPLRIVEGPYDVLEDTDVCLFGFITLGQLKLLSGHSVILCPDGDVWTDPILQRRFMDTVGKLVKGRYPIDLVGVEYLPDGKDPDEVRPSDRTLLLRSDIVKGIISDRRNTSAYRSYGRASWVR